MKDEQVFQAIAQSSPQCQGALGMYIVSGHRDRRNEFRKRRLSTLPWLSSLLLNTRVYRPTIPMGYLMSPGIYTMDPVFIPHCCLSCAFLRKMTQKIKQRRVSLPSRVSMQKQRTCLGLHIFKEFCWKWRKMTDRLVDRQTSYMRR